MKLSEKVAVVSIGEKKFAMVPVADMRVDKAYQRTLKKRVKKMAARWDYNKCDVLVTSFRDDAFYIVDGQHRYEAAKMNGVQYLACQVLEGMNQVEEAQRYLSQNTESCTLTPYDMWNANLLVGDPIDCTVNKLCKEYNVKVMGCFGTKGASVLGSLTEARNIVKTSGAAGLRWILEVLNDAKWGEVKRGHNSHIMRALRRFYVTHKHEIFRYTDRVKCILHMNDPVKFQSKAVAMFPEVDVATALSRYVDFVVTGEPSEAEQAETKAA